MTSAGYDAAPEGQNAIQVRVRPPSSNAPRSIVPGSFGIGGSERRKAQNARPANAAAAVAIDKNAIFRNLRMLTSIYLQSSSPMSPFGTEFICLRSVCSPRPSLALCLLRLKPENIARLARER